MLAYSEAEGTVACVGLVLHVVLAIIAAKVAENRGGTPWVWGLLTFFFGLLAMLLMLVVTWHPGQGRSYQPRYSEDVQQVREEMRTQRIEDQVWEERMRQHPPRPARTQQAPQYQAPYDAGGWTQVAPAPAPVYVREWYFELEGEQKGPVDDATLAHLIQSGIIQPGVLVWIEGMQDWAPVEQIPELRRYFA